jgi:HPt (histidine-containing phosphotransfer) domain-containing protein
MNNKNLYITMLGRFKVRQMTETLLDTIKEGDFEKITFAAHALKGTSGNLGFPTLYKLTGQMEAMAKTEEDVSHLVAPLEELVDIIVKAIQDFIAAEG